ncbi:unnamed protein product [Bubo scandiacus]
MKINENEGRPLSILFRGCSFLLAYQGGVLSALRELSPDILKSASRIYGASSGSIIATAALCECDIGKGYPLPFILCLKRLHFGSFLNALKNFSCWCVPGEGGLQILKNILNKHLPTNAHQLVSGKLHIILTRLRDWRCVVVSEFASREDIIQAVVCSCFVPVYFGFSLPVYHGVRYIDGELSMWRANFVTRTTITVSGFAGEYDICPKDCPAAFFNFQISDCILQISKRNIHRLWSIFLLPTQQVLDQLFTHGYQDTVSFLKRLSAFGINYLDEDFMLSLASCHKDEDTVYWKPERRVLCSRATDPEDVTEENPGTIMAEDEEEASLHLHHQKGPCQPQKSIFDPTAAFGPSSHFKERTSNLQPSLQSDTERH